MAERTTAAAKADEQAQQAQQAQQAAHDEPQRLDETIPGGKYTTNDGRLVNAHGQEIDASGKVKKADD